MNQSDINDTLMDYDDYYDYNTTMYERYRYYYSILKVSSWLIVTIGLVLTPFAIFAVSSLVKKDNVAPTFVINLLVSDIIQLCAMILTQTGGRTVIVIGNFMYFISLVASIGFILCIALERYLAIVWPLWYRTRRTVKMSLLLCAVVWTLPVFCLVLNDWGNLSLIVCVLFLLPFPLFIFFLVGTLRALSASISVNAEEKRRIIGLLVLVLLIYTLLSLSFILSFLLEESDSYGFKSKVVALYFLRLNPVADMFLYIFLRKGVCF